VLASQADASATVIDYGRTPVASVDLGVELALLTALRELRDQISGGWPIRQEDGSLSPPHAPDAVWCDANWMTSVVYQFVREYGAPVLPAIGRSTTQNRRNYYQRPGSGSSVKHTGDGFHIVYVPAERLHRVDFDADIWKSRISARLDTPPGQPGALVLFAASAQEHLSIARHFCAEEMIEEFVAGRGVVQRWEARSPNNHWLDAAVLASIAACCCGATPAAVMERRTASDSPEQPPASSLLPDQLQQKKWYRGLSRRSRFRPPRWRL